MIRTRAKSCVCDSAFMDLPEEAVKREETRTSNEVDERAHRKVRVVSKKKVEETS